MKRKLGIVTIGQSPRVDVVPGICRLLPDKLEVEEIGALDDLSVEEIRMLVPESGMFGLITRLRDGSEVTVAKEKIMPLVENAVDILSQKNVGLTLLLCNGEFGELESTSLVIQPQKIVNNLVSGVLSPESKLGVIVPIESQVDWVQNSFSGVVSEVIAEVASPYTGEIVLRKVCKNLKDSSVTLIVLYCMGYTQQFAEQVRSWTGLPVILSNSVVASTINELVA
jgi:protein AroM